MNVPNGSSASGTASSPCGTISMPTVENSAVNSRSLPGLFDARTMRDSGATVRSSGMARTQDILLQLHQLGDSALCEVEQRVHLGA